MAKSKQEGLVELRFPVGGLDQNAGFDQQPPYTTPWAQNVRPFDVVNLADTQMHGGRQRGGARPGIVKHDATQLGEVGSRSIQMLASVSVLGDNGIATRIILAVANGVLYENSTGTLTAVATPTTAPPTTAAPTTAAPTTAP